MTFDKVALIIAEYKGIDAGTISEASSFADLKLDSLDVADLAMNLEDELDVTIELSPDIKTVGDLIKVIDAAK